MKGVLKALGFFGYDALFFGGWISTLRRNVISSLSRVKRSFFVHISTHVDKDTMFLQTVGNKFPNDTASYPSKRESSKTTLRKSQISESASEWGAFERR
jgi:hypothetical protein